MLCEISSVFSNFLFTYLLLFSMAIISMMIMSGGLFYKYYANPTFETWQYKTNPKFPSPEMVQGEIFHMVKGAMVGVFCPTISLWASANGYFQGYCGLKYGLGYEIFMFMFIWIFSDFYEFSYHRLGHTLDFFWFQHKSHHRYFNPTPFAVIADDAVDQVIRAFPLILIPAIIPTNMDLLYAEYVLFFYCYGIYLHWGFELDYPDAHHPYINTAFQHYIHHARSGAKTPYHCGFFFKIWDQLWDVTWKDECLCAKCCRERGERTKEKWCKVVKPDYSILLSPTFWVKYLTKFNLN